jgi:hypothetical protein
MPYLHNNPPNILLIPDCFLNERFDELMLACCQWGTLEHMKALPANKIHMEIKQRYLEILAASAYSTKLCSYLNSLKMNIDRGNEGRIDSFGSSQDSVVPLSIFTRDHYSSSSDCVFRSGRTGVSVLLEQ